MAASEALLVVLTCGAGDGGRKAAIAFGVALAALANGSAATVFLTLESAPFGTPTGAKGIHPRGFSEPLDEYVRHFLELGGRLEVCSSCFEEYCRDLPKDAAGVPLLRAGTAIETLGIVARRVNEMPVLTF